MRPGIHAEVERPVATALRAVVSHLSIILISEFVSRNPYHSNTAVGVSVSKMTCHYSTKNRLCQDYVFVVVF